MSLAGGGSGGDHRRVQGPLGGGWERLHLVLFGHQPKRGPRSNRASGTVRVGVTVPLSGALAAYGKGVRDGVRLAVERVNKSGGIGGRSLALVLEDNRGDKTDTRNSIQKLAGIDQVAAIIGPITSTNALAAKLEAARLRVPILSPTATNDQVTANCPYMFRACYVDSFQGRIVAHYAYATLGIRKAAILTDKSSDYSKGLSTSFRKAFEAAGGAVAAEEGYQQKDTDFGAQLARVKARGAELIFVPGYPPEVPQIIKQAKVVGFAGRDITRLPAHRIARLGIARTFQNIRLLGHLSVLDNVKIAYHKHIDYHLLDAVLRLPRYRATEREITVRCLEFLRLLGLEDRAGDSADSLPYGRRRALEIARALATEGSLLLLDEPAAGLNPHETRELSCLLRRIRDQFAVTILLIEHDMKLVMNVCERVVVLDYGKTIARGTPEEIKADPLVIEAYLGRRKSGE